MERKLYLIDGHALIFKMFYAFMRRPMINSKGADMSILFGFTKYLLELIEREQPTHIAVAFDPPAKTFRHEMYPAYKGTRPPAPQLVKDALEPLTEICEKLNIPVLMMPGYEADDVIGAVAKRAEKEGYKVYMVTPDKDYGQLISPNITQIKPGKSGGDDEIIDTKAICDKYGICRPEQVIDMLAICGDSADNVPGVNGVGEVGASKLIGKYGSLENIYEHIDELSTKQKAMFEEARGHIDLSKELVTIKTDLDVEVPTEKMILNKDYDSEIVRLFDHYEFGSLKRFISHVSSEKTEEKKSIDFNKCPVSELITKARERGRFAIVTDSASDSIFSSVIKVTAATEDGFVADGKAEEFAEILADENIAKYGFDVKLQLNQLTNSGLKVEGRLADIALMHYLVDPEKSHKIDMLCRAFLGVELESEPAQAVDLFSVVSEEDSSREAMITILTGIEVEKKLFSEGLQDLYQKMEEPLIRVLSKMERSGVKIDTSKLKEYADMLACELAERQESIRGMADEPSLNISSPKQIGAVLYEKLKLDPKMKAKASGSYPTDEETLDKLADKHPIVDEILEFRAAKKLLSTYIEPFPGYISPKTGRIHTTFNQALTATGRLSSAKPNLQNIPIRTERGREIRKAFVPGTPEGFILSADYSQIELRIMAHLSGDRHLTEAFRAGLDVHKATAAKIFGIEPDEVTPEQRRIAKTANFGIMYGISSFGLAQRLRIGRTQAKQIIDDYFANFPDISRFIENTLESARENGYVETLFGRRRLIPDINAANANVRALAQRNAVNAPIQGTSADIIKMAMVNVDRRMAREGLESKMVLQIHDELVFDTLADEVDTLSRIVREEMESVTELSVPLTVECNYGKNWLEAH